MVLLLLCHFKGFLNLLFHKEVHFIEVVQKGLVEWLPDIFYSNENSLNKLVKAQAQSQNPIYSEILALREEIARVLILYPQHSVDLWK